MLDQDQVECIATKYSGAPEDNENTKERERAFKEMDNIKGKSPEEIAAHISKPENQPGQITQLFIDGNANVIALEALKDRLNENYKAKGLAMIPSRARVSDELVEDLKDEQINELNGDPVDIEKITARIEAFLAPKATARGRPAPKKPENKGKKGGFRTRRRRRA
jgi:hypothetical protein